MATAGWLRNQRGETRRNNERICLKPELCQACLFILTELTCSPSRPCLCLSLLCCSLASLQLHLRHPPKQITKTPKCLENGQGKNFYWKASLCTCCTFLLLLFSCWVVSDSLWPHELQHAMLPCPSPSPGVCSNSYPLSWLIRWIHQLNGWLDSII